MDTPASESTISLMASSLMIGKGNSSRVLFLGARAGGLFRSGKLFEIVRQFSNPSFSSLPVAKQFSECFKVLKEKFGETDISTILVESLKNQPFSTADACLADLVKERLFDVIISTNVDNLLERALNRVELGEPSDFYVRVPKRVFYTGSKSIPLIKVFGDLKFQEYRLKDEFYLDRDKDLKEALGPYLSRDILMIGFDPTWDREIEDIYPLKGGSIWYIDEELPADTTRISRALHYRQGSRSIKGLSGTYDSFVQELHNCIIGKGPLLSHDLVREIFNQLREIRELAIQTHNDISELQNRIQDFQTNKREN